MSWNPGFFRCPGFYLESSLPCSPLTSTFLFLIAFPVLPFTSHRHDPWGLDVFYEDFREPSTTMAGETNFSLCAAAIPLSYIVRCYCFLFSWPEVPVFVPTICYWRNVINSVRVLALRRSLIWKQPNIEGYFSFPTPLSHHITLF